MKTIKIELAEDMAVGTKVSGEWLQVNIDKVDQSWLAEFLRYGIQRKINDMFAGQGENKLEMAKGLVKDINQGKAKPEQVRRGAGVSADPVRKLARTMARDALSAAFKQATGETTFAAMAAKNEKVAAFFKIGDDGKATWRNDKLDSFIESKPNGKDFMADAKAALDIQLEGDDALAELGL